MPKKIRELIQELKTAGFADRGGKGSHRNFKHPAGWKITISGNPGHDAKKYQEREVEKIIREVGK
ncbi:MAG: type II toxin-antitoxin system HicA family toxin [Kiritimatiellales bacterium]|nr:type II toxin-antitoxin system HicA family toxin [Kiritimatiellales bacterium]MCF7864574.1 type II toxin-antitoxin system HicA family toxin [Kiritimatiellales bacterium]